MKGYKITTLLHEKNMSRPQLCEAIGMSNTNLGLIIGGGSTSTATLERIADFFGVSPAYFYTDDEAVQPTTRDGTCHDCVAKDEMIAELRERVADLRNDKAFLTGSTPLGRAGGE